MTQLDQLSTVADELFEDRLFNPDTHWTADLIPDASGFTPQAYVKKRMEDVNILKQKLGF